MENIDIFHDILGAPQKEWYENMQYCCPFHREKTGSFSINKKTGLWKCFWCGKGWNVYTFIKEYFGEQLYIEKLLEYKLITENKTFKKAPPYKKKLLEEAHNLFLERTKKMETSIDVKYLFLKRRIFKNEIIKHNIGTTLDLQWKPESDVWYKDFKDKIKLYNRLLIPAKTIGSDPYIIGRSIDWDKKSLVKYKNDKMNKKGKIFFTWNQEDLKLKTWYLSEGVIDGIKIHKYFNKTIIHTLWAPTKDFVKKLSKKIVHTIFDNDLAAIKFNCLVLNDSFLNYDVYPIMYELFFQYIVNSFIEKFSIKGLEEKVFTYNVFDFLYSKDMDEVEEKLFYLLAYFYSLRDALIFDDELKVKKEDIINISTDTLYAFKKWFDEKIEEDPYLFEEVFLTFEKEIGKFFQGINSSFVNDQEYIFYSSIKEYLINVGIKKPNVLKKLYTAVINHIKQEYKLYIEKNDISKAIVSLQDFLTIMHLDFYSVLEKVVEDKSLLESNQEEETQDVGEIKPNDTYEEGISEEEIALKDKQELLNKLIQRYFLLLPNGVQDLAKIFWNTKMYQKFFMLYITERVNDLDLDEIVSYVAMNYDIQLQNKEILAEFSKENKEENIEIVTINKDFLLQDIYFYYFLYKLPDNHFRIIFPSIKKIPILNDELLELTSEFEGSNIIWIKEKKIIEDKNTERIDILNKMWKLETPIINIINNLINIIEWSNIRLTLDDNITPITYQQWLDSVINYISDLEVDKNNGKIGYTINEKNNFLNLFIQLTHLISNYNFMLLISQI